MNYEVVISTEDTLIYTVHNPLPDIIYKVTRKTKNFTKRI